MLSVAGIERKAQNITVQYTNILTCSSSHSQLLFYLSIILMYICYIALISVIEEFVNLFNFKILNKYFQYFYYFKQNYFVFFSLYRITAVCGDFYIGGRQFDSLPDLIGYYTSCSDLLKRERLMHPVAPPEPVNDKKRIVAILPYTKMPDTDELR